MEPGLTRPKREFVPPISPTSANSAIVFLGPPLPRPALQGKGGGDLAKAHNFR
jgi:hypothetical protein